MTKREIKQMIYRRFMRMVEPDNRAELEPHDLGPEDEEIFDEACREVMMEMERRSYGITRRKPGPGE